MVNSDDNEYSILITKSGDYFYYRVDENNHFLVPLTETQKIKLKNILEITVRDEGIGNSDVSLQNNDV